MSGMAQDLHSLLNLDPREKTDREKYDDDSVRAAILRDPAAVKLKHRFKAGDMNYEMHPLPWAIGLGCSLDILKLLYQTHPPAMTLKDNYGSSPLHYASFFARPADVVMFVYGERPEAIAEKNHWGDLPLHCACWCDSVPTSVMQFLAERKPDCLEEENVNHVTPLLAAEQSKKPREVLKLLNTLQRILNEKPSDEEVAAMLQERDGGISWENRVAPILNHRGAVVHELHLGDQLFPTLLARVGRECRVQAMYFMIRGLPGVFEGR